MNSSIPELRRLAQYEELCRGAVIDRSSFFTTTPTTVSQAQSSANEVASILKAFAKYNVPALVFIEPSESGKNIDLNQYKNGQYNSALDTYFATLRSAGINDSTMGTWVFLPEGNLPIWSTNDPSTYAAVVTKTAQIQKKYFPNSKSSIMLDSASYPVGGTWGQGKYISFAPYVKDIPKGLIDSFGLQGFPWAGPATQPNNVSYNPKSYLQIGFAIEAARMLGTKEVWVNTGTFNRMHTSNSSETVTLSPQQRQTMLYDTIQQVQQAKAQGFAVAMHIFAQDKSSSGEATDWSYWHDQPGSDANTLVFSTFAYKALSAGIPIWLYDTE
jgi:hypothetical protein